MDIVRIYTDPAPAQQARFHHRAHHSDGGLFAALDAQGDGPAGGLFAALDAAVNKSDGNGVTNMIMGISNYDKNGAVQTAGQISGKMLSVLI